MTATALIAARDDVPLPLAQLIGRALNAASILERHQCVFYVGEAALKLAASVRLAHALAAGLEPGSPLALATRRLTRASLGHWQELLREGDRAVPGPRLDAAAGPGGEALLEAMVAEELLSKEAARAARKAGALGVLDALVTYRNAVIGHGAPRVPGFYEAWAARLAEAIAGLLASPALLRGHQLVIAEKTEEGAARWRLLRGVSALPWDGAALTAAPGELCFVGEGGAVSARPLLAHRAEVDLLRDRLGFLQEVRARQVEYLDYVTGETFTDEAARSAVTALLAQSGGDAASPPERSPPRVEPGGQLGGYELIELLGRGGQGVVFRARQLALDRQVAVKVLDARLAADDHVRRRFDREVRALVRSDHPNVVKVFAAGEEQGICYYAMELIDGLDLAHGAAALREARSVPSPTAATVAAVAAVAAPSRPDGPDLRWRRLATLFAGAADGVQHLHDRGVVHRDLKPQNLMLTRDGQRLVVTDLGLARTTDASALTREGGLLGTLRAMAPEQLDGGEAATRPAVDVFGLGVALFEAATGRMLRDGPTDAAVIAQMLERPPRADRVAPEVPRALADVIARALEQDPTARFPSAAALAEALRAFAAGAMRPSTPSHRVALVAALGALAAGGAITALLLTRSPGAAAPIDDARRIDAPAPIDATAPADAPAPPPGMVWVAGATLDLGSSDAEIDAVLARCRERSGADYCAAQACAFRSEVPRRTAIVAGFFLDRQEVARGALVEWLEQQGDRVYVDAPGSTAIADDGAVLAAIGEGTGITRVSGRFTVAPEEAALPAIGLTWEGARRLCAARGARLPTEAEWERAARGTERRTYSWGPAAPGCATAVWSQTCADQRPGMRPVDRALEDEFADLTPELVRDLGGNVSEWVDDDAPARCTKPAGKVIRGGSYLAPGDMLRGAARTSEAADTRAPDLGVRCAL